MRVAIFIDGAYLSKVVEEHHGVTSLSYEKLSNHLAAGYELLRSYFYDAPPYQSNPVTPTHFTPAS